MTERDHLSEEVGDSMNKVCKKKSLEKEGLTI